MSLVSPSGSVERAAICARILTLQSADWIEGSVSGDEVVGAIGSQFQLPKNCRYGALKDVVPVGRGRFTSSWLGRYEILCPSASFSYLPHFDVVMRKLIFEQ